MAAPGTASAGKLADDEISAVTDALADFMRMHEGRPQGVPRSYDWFSRPVMKQGNNPAGNKAMTGWGHAFWVEGSGQAEVELRLRNLHVYLCAGVPGTWTLVQSGKLYGREFDADFKQNINRLVRDMHADDDELTVSFRYGAAFHFWPVAGRYVLPDEPLCGVVVTVEARQFSPLGKEEAASGRLLLGLGADYWRDRTAVWDGKGSNPGIALGRLKYVAGSWRWHALNTASRENTMRLLDEGYTDHFR